MTTDATWHLVGALVDLPVGEAVRVETPDGEVAVFLELCKTELTKPNGITR